MELFKKSGDAMDGLKKMKNIELIGKKIRKAREIQGFTQEEVADSLGIGRPRYSEMENGKRNIALKDLYQFAELFGRSLDYFLKEDVSGESFKMLFRKTEGDAKISDIIIKFETLCENTLELEKINEQKMLQPTQQDYSFEKNRLKFWAKHYADYERGRLVLGNAPLKNLEVILEEKCGLKIFYTPFPDEKKVYGLFTYNEMLGGCILINSAPCRGNQLFSLAHEYAHFLFHKAKVGIISYEKNKKSADEQLANYFASEFLMPENEIRSMATKVAKTAKDMTAEDIVYFSDYFGVSFTAMAYRLNNLQLLGNERKNSLLEETEVGTVRSALGLQEEQTEQKKVSSYYMRLCINAFLKNKISTSMLAKYLEMPLYEAMSLVKGLRDSKG